MLHIIPPFTDAKPAVMNIIAKAGVTYIDATKLHELWPHVHSGAIVIASLPPTQMAVLMRHIETLLPEMPAVVTAVPGAFYSAEWNVLAAALPAESWTVLEGKLAKSGLLANTTEQAQDRSRSSLARPALAEGGLMERARGAVASASGEEEEDDMGAVDQRADGLHG